MIVDQGRQELEDEKEGKYDGRTGGQEEERS